MSLVKLALYFVALVRFCAGAVNEFLGKNGPYMAAAISFYSLFSIFPLFIATVSLVSWILGSNRVGDWLITEIPRQLPVGQDLVAGVFKRVDEQRIVGSVLALAALFWASTAVFGAIRKSVNNIWGIRRTRPFFQERLMDFALMFGASALMLFSIFITTFPTAIQHFLNSHLAGGAPFVAGFLGKVAIALPWLAVFPTFLILYMWLPNTHVRFRDVWLTAFGAGAVFEVATVVFVQFIRTFPSTLDLYGTVSATMALLAWVYVSSIILLSGALATSRYAAWMARLEQQRRVDDLSKNLDRIRAHPLALATPE